MGGIFVMREVRKLSDADVCESGDCPSMATSMVYSRKLDKVVLCCEPHADIVVDEHNPEYTDICENCGCMYGVN